MSQTPKSRLDVLPHYSRLIATLSKYMPDIGADVVAGVSLFVRAIGYKLIYAQLDDEFRYLQRKKNVIKELSEIRRKVNHRHPRSR